MATFNILFVLLCISLAQCQKVQTKQGWVQGREGVTMSTLSIYYAFFGIPYAKPPIGHLRFKAPRPALPWKGVRDATEYGSKCVQFDIDIDQDDKLDISERFVGEEDCLFVNVFTPDLSPREPFPVIIFIHGDLYRRGSGNDDLYGPQFLLQKRVCLVTLNYRLGPLGFLTLDIPDIPGNAGLKDQVLAFKWVKENIASFGCDPGNITLFGHGAGSASVSLHLVSPATRGLFHRAIMSSGVFLSGWSSPSSPVKRAYALGRGLGLDTNDPIELRDFLLSQPVQRLAKIYPKLYLSDNTTFVENWNFYTPVREIKFGPGQYLTDNPVDLLCDCKINKVDVLIGHTQQELFYYSYLYERLILKNYPYFYSLFVPNNIATFRSPRNQYKISRKIQDYYFTNATTVTFGNYKQFIDLISDSTQRYPINEFIERFPKLKTKKFYVYRFDLFEDRNVYGVEANSIFAFKKSTYGDDIPYLFDGTKFYPKVKLGTSLYKLVDMMTSLFTNFAKFGTPTPNLEYHVNWTEYGEERNYVSIGNTLKLEQFTGFKDGDAGFWRKLYRKSGVDFRDLWNF